LEEMGVLGTRVSVIACDFIYGIGHDMTSEHSDGVIELLWHLA